jgi:hypothetical protein
VPEALTYHLRVFTRCQEQSGTRVPQVAIGACIHPWQVWPLELESSSPEFWGFRAVLPARTRFADGIHCTLQTVGGFRNGHWDIWATQRPRSGDRPGMSARS